MSSPRINAALADAQENAREELVAQQPTPIENQPNIPAGRQLNTQPNVEPKEASPGPIAKQPSAEVKEEEPKAQIEAEIKEEPKKKGTRFPANGLLEAMLRTYSAEKEKPLFSVFGFSVGKESPTYSNAMKALQSIKEECPRFQDQERLYCEGILLNILYHADMSSKAAKDFKTKAEFEAYKKTYAEDAEAHKEFKKNAESEQAKFNTADLEQKFLDFYKKGYFSKRTTKVLVAVEQKITLDRRAKAAQVAASVDDGNVFPASSKRSMASTRRSTASTVAAESVAAYGAGEADSIDDEGYRMFRENYAIFVILKLEESKKRLPPLSDAQFKLYKEILSSFVLCFDKEQSSALYNTIMNDFGFTGEVKGKIQRLNAKFKQKLPDVLDEHIELDAKLDIDITQRQTVIARMVEQKNTRSGRLLNDSRLDALFKKPAKHEANKAGEKEIDESELPCVDKSAPVSIKNSVVVQKTLLRTLKEKNNQLRYR